jgi:HSP20 family protein
MADAQKQHQRQESEAIAKTQPQETKPRRTDEPSRPVGEIMRSSPFSLMERLFGDMGRLFEDFTFGGPPLSPLAQLWSRGDWTPQVDIVERDGNMIVRADLPGLKQDDVKVNVDNDVLTISGERSETTEQKTGGIYRRERSYGTFERSIALPEGVDPAAIQASFENGVLEIVMPIPKEDVPRGRAIPIRSSSSAGSETKH